jgi:glycine C-acetyltransferase
MESTVAKAVNNQPASAENLNLGDFLMQGRKMTLQDRIAVFSEYKEDSILREQCYYFRKIVTATGRKVDIIDPFRGNHKSMLMFGSNNYLGLANHPYIKEYVKHTIDQVGTGIGGPPLQNGYLGLTRELEQRLSKLKHTEDTILFSSGYNTNIGLVSALCQSNDMVFTDDQCHASFFDGLKLSRARTLLFKHNDVADLKTQLLKYADRCEGDLFVSAEGVYSIDGDLSPLDKIWEVCKEFNAWLIIDDAHGTGVLGAHGGGSCEHFGIEGARVIKMGTFSKSFAVTGGFVSCSKPLIDYLRFFARSYLFSAALTPVILATVLAGLDVMEAEPERRIRLLENVAYARKQLARFTLAAEPGGGIITLKIPPGVNVRNLSADFHREGIFLNPIEYPAVPMNQQRFRISMMCEHTREDIDRLVDIAHKTWEKNNIC